MEKRQNKHQKGDVKVVNNEEYVQILYTIELQDNVSIQTPKQLSGTVRDARRINQPIIHLTLRERENAVFIR